PCCIVVRSAACCTCGLSLRDALPISGFVVAAALAWAGVTRGNHLADPAFRHVPVAELLSKEYAADIAARIRRGELPDRKKLNKPDRKSTRLNSSHVKISYAVFCLKKK